MSAIANTFELVFALEHSRATEAAAEVASGGAPRQQVVADASGVQARKEHV